MRIVVAGRTDPGRVRELNEDRFYYKVVQASDEEPMGLFIVADGMGGHLAGEVASKWAMETLKREMSILFKPRDPRATVRLARRDIRAPARKERNEAEIHQLIRAAVQRANEVVLTYARKKPGEASGMGSTVTLAVVDRGMATVANVGDSRTYLWRDGRLQQLTRDHSLAASLVAAGKLAHEEMYDHPQRHILYRCLGVKALVEVDIFSPLGLQAGDTLLLCSDGLWETFRSSEAMASILKSTPDAEEICRQLVQAANDKGGEDNISVVVARLID